MSDNPYKIEARNRKAARIVDHILSQEGAAECNRDLLAAELESLGPAARRHIAHMAGQYPPSDETWTLVTRLVRRLEVAA